MSVGWATIMHDPDGLLAVPLDVALKRLRALFSGIFVETTTRTSPAVLAILDKHGAEYETSPPDPFSIGRHRRVAIAMALRGGAERVLYTDPDHLIRWSEADPDELQHIIERSERADCIVVGKSPRSFRDVPAHLRETEAIVNRVFELVTAQAWELMSAVRALSRRAAELIVAESDVDTIGNDVDWPLRCLRAGLQVEFVASDALRYETLAGLAQPGDARRAELEPKAWVHRTRIAVQQLEAMLPYMEERQGH